MSSSRDSFLSEHSPRGAEASFDLGVFGRGGGFSLESGTCSDQPVHLGWHQDGCLNLLPFSPAARQALDTGMAEFVPTGGHGHGPPRTVRMRYLSGKEISRDFAFATDTWRTAKLTFSLVTPTAGGADPDTASPEQLREAYAPAIVGQLTLDNTSGSTPMTGVFAVGSLGGFSFLADTTGGRLEGIQCLNGYGLAVRGGKGVRSFSDLDLPMAFDRIEPLRVRLSGMGGVLIDVPAGQSRTVDVALGWYRSGVVTLGKACRYYYTKLFDDFPAVLAFALDRAEAWRAKAAKEDQALKNSSLNADQQFLLAKSIRSYYGSTQLFAEGDSWRWIVNEGSCNMANTLDLTVDMAFYEAAHHPWLLRDVLDRYAEEYCYRDTVHAPGESGTPLPGGVSFTHDQGVRNVFSPEGVSHYELSDHPGCFSFMTHEELLNWVLCAALYFKATEDRPWLARRAPLLAECLESMQNRDHRDPAQRDGLMSFDSDQCGQTEEITTYDSLDPSLGQARRNAYMGGKCWATYLALQWLLGQDDSKRWQRNIASAYRSAELAARTLTQSFDEKLGYIPAILDGKDTSAIIPVIEPLVYPDRLGLADALKPDGPFAEFLAVLKRHLRAVLVKGVCLFGDDGWKLSANNDNSWMSKIFIGQYVARKYLGMGLDESGKADGRYDRAHADWWRVGCECHSVIDQVIAGQAAGWGSIYPRCVSCYLWLEE